MILTFRILSGDQLIRVEHLTGPVIKIGRVASSNIKLDDTEVSRMHALIEVNGPDAVKIIDLGSVRGTFVNGHKVNGAKLSSGDVVVLGDTRLEITFEAAP